jgi:hypothetical protein
MKLDSPSGLREKLDQRLIIHGLDLTNTSPETGNKTA